MVARSVGGIYIAHRCDRSYGRWREWRRSNRCNWWNRSYWKHWSDRTHGFYRTYRFDR
jgi:hypothetical protein